MHIIENLNSKKFKRKAFEIVIFCHEVFVHNVLLVIYFDVILQFLNKVAKCPHAENSICYLGAMKLLACKAKTLFKHFKYAS